MAMTTAAIACMTVNSGTTWVSMVFSSVLLQSPLPHPVYASLCVHDSDRDGKTTREACPKNQRPSPLRGWPSEVGLEGHTQAAPTGLLIGTSGPALEPAVHGAVDYITAPIITGSRCRPSSRRIALFLHRLRAPAPALAATAVPLGDPLTRLGCARRTRWRRPSTGPAASDRPRA